LLKVGYGGRIGGRQGLDAIPEAEHLLPQGLAALSFDNAITLHEQFRFSL